MSGDSTGQDKAPETMTVSMTELEAAFTEWDRDFFEDPMSFDDRSEQKIKEDHASYGKDCASYLVRLIEGIREGR